MLPPEVAAAGPEARVGRYVCTRVLGSGGMGEVWQAWDVELARWVALKFLKGSDADEIARFKREAQTAARLSHPNIAAIHDVGEHGGRPFIAMQYVEGRTLRSVPPSRRRDLVRMIRDAARAVACAHARGVVHRDLKPENLMVTGTGHVFVMDFGLARSMEVKSGLTQSGVMVGTPAYMAPEQARAERVDARADVWSLGATLYDLACGRKPFGGDSMLETLTRVTGDDPEPPRVDPELDAILLKCLEKEPERRYASAAELAADLDRYLAGEAVLARPATVGYRLGKQLGRRKPVVALSAMAALAVAGLVAAVWAMKRADDDRRGRAATAVALADALQERGQYAEAKARYDEARALGGAVPAERYARCVEAIDRSIKLAQQKEKFGPLLERSEAALRRAEDLRRSPSPRFAEWSAPVREALEALNEALSADPGWAAGFAMRARLRLLMLSDTVVEADLTEALRLDPSLVSARYDRARVWMDQLARHAGHRCPAVEELRGRVAAEFEIVRRAWGTGVGELEACVRWASGDAEGAIAAADGVRGNARVLRLKGDALFQLRRFDEAEEALDASIRASPSAEAYALRGRVKGRRGDWKGEIGDCTTALELNPACVLAWSNRGVARGETGDWPGEIDDCTRALEIDPAYVLALLNRAWAHEQTGDLERAEADATRATQAEPRLEDAWLRRAHLRSRRQNWRGEIEDYTKAIEINPHPVTYCNRGIARGRMGDWKGQEEDETRAIELDPKLVGAYNTRAIAREHLGDLAGAVDDFTTSIELERAANPLAKRGRLRMKLAEGATGEARRRLLEGAIADFEECLTLGPSKEVERAAPLWIGDCRRRLGE